ncbi:AMP-binding protein [Lentisphaerota bacterium ZTH]|nr:AMP-binding protein [Lentisphaerota bacterium]WET05979.1 AMP-binding protein [Lentisphaerota bacterium ZTH]
MEATTTDKRYGLRPMGGSFFLSIFNLFCFFSVVVLTCRQSVEAQAGFMFWSGILYLLPFLLLSSLVRFVIKRVARRNILVMAKFFELLIMVLAAVVLLLPSSGMMLGGSYAVMLLLGIEGAFLFPAAQGVCADLFKREDIARVCGVKNLFAFGGIIAGCAGGAALHHLCVTYFNASLGHVAAVLFFSGMLGAVLAMHIPAGLPDNRVEKFEGNIFRHVAAGCLLFYHNRSLRITALGECYLLASFFFIEAVLIIFARDNLAIPGFALLSYGLILAAPLAGVALGSLFSGCITRRGVELGLVPIGAGGAILFSILTGLYPGSMHFYYGVAVFPQVLCFMLLFGICYGIMLDQLQAWQLWFVPKADRALFYSMRNLLFFFDAMVAGTVIYLLTLQSMNSIYLLVIFAAVTAFFAALAFLREPQFLVRLLILIMRHSLYRLNVYRQGDIPDEGPAVLVANHASLIDHLLLQSCTPRPIRFMMHESFYRYPLLYPFVKWAGIIEVPQAKPRRLRQLLERTRKILKNGEVLCVFPEGGITRNGIMSNFKKGLSLMLPEELEIPVIPVRIGMLWGSIFSYFYGRIRLRIPQEIPHPAAVTIGKPVSRDLTGYEMRLILSEMAAETESIPLGQERPLHSQFAFVTRRHPLRKMIKEYDGSEWKEHSNFSILVKAILVSREIRKMTSEDSKYVGMMLPNGSGAVVILLAILMADKVPAILNFTASKAAIQSAIDNAGLELILTSRRFLSKINYDTLPEMFMLEKLAGRITRFRKTVAVLMAALLPWRELMNIISPVSHQDVHRTGALIFSSGSTGIPKGVMLSHHNMNSDLYSFIRIMNWRGTDKIIGNLPIFHSFGLTVCFWLPLTAAADVVYIPNPLDAKSVGYAVKRAGVTLMMATPGFLQNYMRRCNVEDFKSLRLVVTGAEKLRNDIADKFKEMTGLTIAEGYGCSELSPVVSINVANSILDLGTSVGKRGSIGTAMPGICVKIVDPESFELLPPDTDGLMLVKGANVMQGYLNEPEKTAEVMHGDFYITGDIAQMNESGYITITGRLSRFSKIAGEMVPHELVEKEINELLLSEERCIAVCGMEDARKGEKLMVFYSNMELDAQEIVQELRSKGLPNLWIPRAENFIFMEKIPMLGSGKLDLAALQKVTENLKTEA